ncbi:LysR family transcriptional regulator [uncultured Ramlibacter sp.]|uniref:LysR family transcriptional regulator n=1 Tax=uncultured Ramlibacter sp. TaxID=260755 RepID=UPI00260D27B2|nr:LysR family transcriptional regulator [uncultured Ramlibacter sp.]
MDHKWLEDFVVLARERSFSKAALARHVTQPQFSRRIRALEMWAGAELVNRAGIPLALTPAGEELLPVARRTVGNLSDTRARIRQTSQTMDWVTLATGRTLSRTTVPAWMTKVRRETKGLRLRIVTGSIHEGATLLEQGGADFLLAFSHPRLPLLLDDQLFEGMAFATDELVPVSAPRNNGKPAHDLPGTAGKPVHTLVYSPTLALAQILQDGLTRMRADLHLYPVTESDFAESLHEQALEGAGLAWLPRALVANDLAAGKLVAVRAQEFSIRFEIRLFRPRQARTALVDGIWRMSAGG